MSEASFSWAGAVVWVVAFVAYLAVLVRAVLKRQKKREAPTGAGRGRRRG